MSKLAIFNPSDYPRCGPVTLPWQPLWRQTGIQPHALALRDAAGNLLPCQVDFMDPADHARDTLAFSLVDAIRPGPEDYSEPSAFVSVESTIGNAAPEPQRARVKVTELDGHVGLVNQCLEVWFNLLPSTTPEDNERSWFAGSATSVRLDDLEILDAFKSINGWEGHDPEKRCMQIDQIQLMRASPGEAMNERVSLLMQPYQLIAKSSGPVRASITLASCPFECGLANSSSYRANRQAYRLYREISLYADADYLIEELLLKRVGPDNQSQTVSDELQFVARYVCYMDMGFEPALFHYASCRDWFAIGCPRWSPYHGYGFATDRHVDSISYVHRDLASLSNEYKRFSWQTLPGPSARCLHIFLRSEMSRLPGHHGHFDHRTGHAWYEKILKDLICRPVCVDTRLRDVSPTESSSPSRGET